MFIKIKKVMKNPKLILLYISGFRIFRIIPDKLFLKMKYYLKMKQKLDLNNPETFNEKLQWIKLYDRKPEYVTYVDKFAVRDYIKQTIGEEYLIPLIGVYDNVNEIPWGDLPNRFVLKCTHGSGCNIICKNKQELDIKESKRKLKRWMKKNYYWYGREWSYKNVKPRIICEEFISGTNKKIPNDLKVMCFNGKAKLIELHIDRFSSSHTQDFYDINWTKTQISQGRGFAAQSSKFAPEPIRFKEMLRLSEILAKNKYHVRIDWYEINGRLYFGEITFFDGSGFEPFDNPEDDLILGSWIDLTMK